MCRDDNARIGRTPTKIQRQHTSSVRPSLSARARLGTYENNRLRATRRPCANNSPSFIHSSAGYFFFFLFLFRLLFVGARVTQAGDPNRGRYTRQEGRESFGNYKQGRTNKRRYTTRGAQMFVCDVRLCLMPCISHLASGIWQVSITQHCCFFDGPKPPTQRPMLFCLFWTRSVQSLRQSPTIDGVLV